MQIISRKHAKEKSILRYFTGKKCLNGHLSERYTSTAQCVLCKKEQYNTKEGVERKRVSQRKYKDSPKGMRYKLLEGARSRAKLKNIEINISIEDIEIPELCPIIGVALNKKSNSLSNYNSPSLDRIDNSKGYIKGNVSVISFRANKLKSDFSITELKLIAKQLLKYIGC